MTEVRVVPGQPVLIDGVQYRAVRRTGDDRIALENVCTLAQSNFTDGDITRFFAAGRLRFELKENIPETFHPQFADFGLLADNLKEIAFRRLSYVLATLQQTTRLSRPLVKRIVVAVAQEIGDDTPPSYSSINRWVKRWQASHDIRGLVPDFFARGSRDSTLDAESIEAMDAIIDEHWMANPRKTRDAVYELVAERVDDINSYRPEHEKITTPSDRTIRRAIATRDKKDVMAAQRSRLEAAAEFHTVMKLVTPDYPNQVAQLDETPLDLSIVDSVYRIPFGRPYLTVTIDVYSRLITGFHVSFSPPSADTAMMCIRHAILDKSYVAEKYPTIKNDWPAGGRMKALNTDNHASYKEKGLVDSLAALRIVQHYSPRGRSWLRPQIERFFGTIATSLLHQLPGTTYSNIIKRGKNKPADKSVFTLEEFIYLIHVWIIDYYNKRKNSGTRGVPYFVYKNGCKRVPIELPRSIEDLDQLLTSAKDAKLTKAGVLMHGLYWNSPELTLLRRRGDAPDKVKVRYNPADISSVWVLDPRTLRYITVPAVDQDYTHGLALDQHKAINNYANELADKQGQKVELSKVRRLLTDITDTAQAKTKRARQAGKRMGRFMEKAMPANDYASPVRGQTFDSPVTAASGAMSEEPIIQNEPKVQEESVLVENSRAVAASPKPDGDDFVPNASRINFTRKE